MRGGLGGLPPPGLQDPGEPGRLSLGWPSSRSQVIRIVAIPSASVVASLSRSFWKEWWSEWKSQPSSSTISPSASKYASTS